MEPHDMTEEIAQMYSNIVKPILEKYTSNDMYSVVIENSKLDYPIYLGKYYFYEPKFDLLINLF